MLVPIDFSFAILDSAFISAIHRKGGFEMRTQRVMIRLFMSIFFSLTLALGCASRPVYQIKYDYLAPESAEGKVCTQQCETAKTQCEATVNKEFEQERLKLQQSYQQCLLTQSSSRSPILCNDSSQAIKHDYSNCLAGYKGCFEHCGGRVEERNVCVRNCR